VTNAITRHPAVAASGIATVDEIAPGRAFFGIGSGDSAILNLAERPSTLADLRAYVETVRALHTKGETTWRGRVVRLTWAKRAIAIYLSAEGPRTLELAGEIADGVIVNVGLEPTLVTDAVAHVHAGARRAGRDPSAIDLWTMVRANVTDDVAAGIDEIKMELASNAHHVFRFTLDGKNVPSALADAIGRVQKGYHPAAHEALGPSPNAALLDAEPALRAYLAERFGAVGPPSAVANKLRGGRRGDQRAPGDRVRPRAAGADSRARRARAEPTRLARNVAASRTRRASYLCLPLICLSGSRRAPEVFVMEPTHAWHLHHPALAWRLHAPGLGRVLGQR